MGSITSVCNLISALKKQNMWNRWYTSSEENEQVVSINSRESAFAKDIVSEIITIQYIEYSIISFI